MTDPSDSAAVTPSFAPLSQSTGVRITDPVEDTRVDLFTTGAVDPTPVDPDRLPFCYPVESAARIGGNDLTAPTRVNVNVRTGEGDLVASATNNGPISVDEPGTYVLELCSTPIKLYVAVRGRVLVLPDDSGTELVFADADTFAIGARSFHKQPARTITTTADPIDLMRAISEFGAALETTSPERAFPTWRSHPPLLELGDSLHIPGGPQRPDTGVRIEVPPELDCIYPVAPLAHYLGAAVRPGDRPRLLADQGFAYPLDGRPNFETNVARVLKHVFTLDCLTRTEGHYEVCLDERERADERELGLDYETLYDAPLADRIARYLSVPFEAVEPLVPRWRLTADIVPAVEYADLLPYVVAELAVVRCITSSRAGNSTPAQPVSPQPDDITEFCRSGRDDVGEYLHEGDGGGCLDEGDGGGRPDVALVEPSARAAPASQTEISPDGDAWPQTGQASRSGSDTLVRQDGMVRVEDAPTITQTYIGTGFPLGASKGSKAAYQRRLSIRSNAPSCIDVTVVCNDSEMQGETAVGDAYGTRDLFEFDVTILNGLTTSGLRETLQTETDFVHYIGHVDARGLQATDGYLDAHALDQVGARAFFLNGCRSFHQGIALVERGAIAGIATIERVHNTVATRVGNTVARLLNAGWSLDGALQLVRNDTVAGRHYIVVGDGLVELVAPDSGVPVFARIEPRTDCDRYAVTIYTHPTRHRHLGTIYTPYVEGNERRYLVGGELDTFVLTAGELREFLSLGSFPVRVDPPQDDGGSLLCDDDGSLRWSDTIDPASL